MSLHHCQVAQVALPLAKFGARLLLPLAKFNLLPGLSPVVTVTKLPELMVMQAEVMQPELIQPEVLAELLDLAVITTGVGVPHVGSRGQISGVRNTVSF